MIYEKKQVEEYMYRFVDNHFTGDPKIHMETYRIIKRTLKGVWISLDGYSSDARKKFVMLGAKRSFAYPTKAAALYSYEKRKAKQIEIVTEQLRKAIACSAMIPRVLHSLACEAEAELKQEQEQRETRLKNIITKVNA